MNKKTCISLFSSLFCFSLAVDGFALPKGHQVVSGTAEFKQLDPHVMEIRPSDQAIINYSKFDVGKGEKVRFIQNSSSSCVLNRVQGKYPSRGDPPRRDPSQILGSLESNGKVFLVDPNGIYFGANSSINVGSLIASTLDISNEDFLQENYSFSLGDKNSVIRNEGALESIEGSIVLMAPQIQNLGSIIAKAGSVVLVLGEHVTLDFAGDGLIQFSTEGTVKEALIEHLGDVTATAVSLKIPAAKKAISEIVNLDGAEEGDVFIEENGVIILASTAYIEAKKVLVEAAKLEVEGEVNAKSLADRGGEVHFFGRGISLEGAQVDVSGALGGGEVLVGGEFQGKGTTAYASKVTVDESSQILANAIEVGDGGQVVLWSQDRTLFNGKVESRGGPLGGNGGLVETSSQGSLEIVTGQVNALAQSGRVGQWLLDPNLLYVNSGQSTPVSCDADCTSCTAGDCSSDQGPGVNVGSINSACADVTLTAWEQILIQSNISIAEAGVGLTLVLCKQKDVNFLVTLGSSSGTSGGSITTNGGAVTFPYLAGISNSNGVTIDTTAGGTNSTGAAITIPKIFTYNINSGVHSAHYDLTLTAGKSDVEVKAVAKSAIEGTSGNNYTVGNLTVTSAGTVQTTGLTIAGTFTLEDSNTKLLVDGTIDTTSGGTKSNGHDITVGSVDGVSSTASATIKAGSSTIDFGGKVGGSTPFENFTISSAGSLALPNITASGAISITPDIILSGSSTITSTGGNITLNSGVSGASSGAGTLILSAPSGSVILKEDLGATPLAGIQITASNIDSLVNMTTSGANSSISVDSPSTLQQATTITSGGGSITFSGEVSGLQTFTVNAGTGSVSLGALGDVSTGSFLDSISVTGGDVTLNGSIATSSTAGDLNIVNSGVLTVNSESISLSGVFNQSSSGDFFLGGSITASSIFIVGTISLVGSAALTSTYDLTLPSNITSSSAQDFTLTSVGGAISTKKLGTSSGPLGDVTLTALNPSSIEGIVTKNGSISINPSLTLSEDSTVDSTNGGASSGADITFASTIDAGSSPALTITAGSGTVRLQDQVGSSNPIASLTITGDSIAQSKSVVVTGDISYTGADSIKIAHSTTSNSGSVTLEGPVLLSSESITIQAQGDINTGTIETNSSSSSVQPLTVTSASGDVTTAAISNLASLTVSGNTLSLGSISTEGEISLSGAVVTLGGSVTNTDIDAGLTITDTTSFSTSGDISVVGAFTQTGGGEVSLSGNISANSIAFADPITLVQTATLAAVSDLTLSSSVNATTAGAQGLTLTGSLAIDVQDIGMTIALGDLEISSFVDSTIHSITTQGGVIELSAPSFTLGSDSVIDSTNGGASGAAVTIAGDINASVAAEQSLTVDATGTSSAGGVALKGSIGSSKALSSLTINGSTSITDSQVTLGESLDVTIQTTGGITINPPLQLASSASMTGGGVKILGGATALTAGSQTLAVNASGAITAGQIGTNEKPLGGVSLTASSASTIQNVITGGGKIILSAPSFTLSSASDDNIYINSTAGGSFEGAPITISGAVDATTIGVEILNIGATGLNDVAGLITLTGPIGDSLILQKFKVEGNSSIYTSRLLLGDSSLSSASIKAEDSIDMSGLYGIDLASSSTLTTASGSIDLGDAEVNGATAGGQSLTLSTASFGVDLGPSGFTTALGAVTVVGSTFNTSGIRTKGAAINIVAPTTLSTNSVIFDTTDDGSSASGANITFSSTLDSKSGTSHSLSMMAGSGGVITFPFAIGGVTPPNSLTITSTSNVNIKDVMVSDEIDIDSSITLSDALTIFTSNSGGDISLGDVDGTTAGAQSVMVSSGSGAVALGVVGADVVLDVVSVPTGSVAAIHSITTSGAIDIDIPVVLAASTTLSTVGEGALGTTITLKAINGTSSGKEDLTIQVGAGNVVLLDKIGYGVPPGNLDFSGSAISFEGSLVSAAGTHSYNGITTISQNTEFRSLGDITFHSTVDPASGTPILALYPGDGALTFADSVGDAPFGAIAVYNAGSFHAQDIFAKALIIAGGEPSIVLEGDVTLSGPGIMVLDGGPISLGAEIIANGLWMRSYGTISNLGFPMPITLTGNRFSNFDYFNAVGGVIGAEESPIDVDSEQALIVGADDRADFTGTPNHSAVGLLPSNRPCIVTFNGVTIVDCNTTSVNIRELFLSLPKNLWYITWLYSSWDNLSNPEFFVQEPVNLGMNPRDLTTFYRKALLYRTDPLLEESVLKLEKVTPQEELAEWEFTVEFPEEAVDLDMPH